MRVYVNGVLQGGSAGIPGTPAEVLLDAAEPNSIVTLDASGIGSTIPQSSIPTLPAVPSSVLLDVANEGKLVSLASTTGVGTAMTYGAATSAGVGQLAATLGDFSTGNGAGGSQLASANPAAVRAVIGAVGQSIFYASDFTPVDGTSPDTAAKSGTGPTSTLIFATGTVARTYGTAGVTAPRAILAIPAGARVVEIEFQVVSLSGVSSGGFRYLTAAVQNVASGIPTALWGVSFPDATAAYAGNLLGGGNSGSNVGSTIAVAGAADRWGRATLALTETRFAAQMATASAGAQPTVWTPPTSPGLPSSVAYGSIPNTSGVTYLVFVYQSFGSGVSNVITIRPTVRVTL